MKLKIACSVRFMIVLLSLCTSVLLPGCLGGDSDSDSDSDSDYTGGAIVTDKDGDKLGSLIDVSEDYVTVLTENGFLYKVDWDGNFVLDDLYYEAADCDPLHGNYYLLSETLDSVYNGTVYFTGEKNACVVAVTEQTDASVTGQTDFIENDSTIFGYSWDSRRVNGVCQNREEGESGEIDANYILVLEEQDNCENTFSDASDGRTNFDVHEDISGPISISAVVE